MSTGTTALESNSDEKSRFQRERARNRNATHRYPQPELLS